MKARKSVVQSTNGPGIGLCTKRGICLAIAALLMLAASTPVLAQPVNNECGAATLIAAGVPVNDNSTGATGTDISTCETADNNDVWFGWFAECDGTVTVSLCGSSFDTSVAVYDGFCGGPQIACNADFCGLQSQTTFNAINGLFYLIRVAGRNGATGAFTLELNCPPTGACCTGFGCQVISQNSCINDFGGLYLGNGTDCTGQCDVAACCSPDGSCQTIEPFNCIPPAVSQFPGTSCETTFCPPFGACCVGGGFCQLLPQDDCELDFFGTWLGGGTDCTNNPCDSGACCDTGGSCTDVPSGTCSFPSVYLGDGSQCGLTGCPGFGACCVGGGVCQILPEADCDNVGGLYLGEGSSCALNPCATGACCDLTGGPCVETDQATCNATPDTLYNGDGTTCNGAPCPGAGDDCLTAVIVQSGVTFIGDSTDATGIDESSCAGTGDVNDVWHRWMADCTGDVIIDTNGSAFDTSLAIFTGCGGTQIACDDDGGDGLQSLITLSATEGVEYWIRVAGFGGATGVYNLTITCPPEGGCCTGNGACVIESPEGCTILGGNYLGDGTSCAGGPCSTGACCLQNGSCTDTGDQAACDSVAGAYLGDGTDCLTSTCPGTGACCSGNGPFTCSVTFQQVCEAGGGVYIGDNTDCTPIPPTTDRCDCNGNNTVDVEELGGGTAASTDTPIAIPDGPGGTIMSTINVGAGGNITDVNVSIQVTHTFLADLDITLTHNGVSVDIFSDNCGGDDNMDIILDDGAPIPDCLGTGPLVGTFSPDNPLAAFNGLPASGAWTLTVVDDAGLDTGTLDSWSIIFETSGGGQASDCNNNGVLDECESPDPSTIGGCCLPDGTCGIQTETDCANAGGVFLGGCSDCTGECPAVGACCSGMGTFTCSVTFQDTCEAGGGVYLGDGTDCTPIPPTTDRCDCNGNGEVDNTELAGGTIGSTDTPIAIPDAGGGSAISVINFGGGGSITDLNVGIQVTHTFLADLDITLEHNGVIVDIFSDNCGGDDNMDIILDDGAPIPDCLGTGPLVGTFSPDNPLAAFNGLNANGVWTLTITDDAGADTGTLDSWSLIISTAGAGQGSDCNNNGVLDECETPDPSTIGGCCQTNGSCAIETEANCVSNGGYFLGGCSDCSNPCPATGACCLIEGCVNTTEDECLNQGGVYVADGVDCSTNPCTVGACCQTTGCTVVSSEDCATLGGAFQGNGTQCGGTGCEYTLVMNDTFGDGWNGATLSILSDGAPVAGSPFGFTGAQGNPAGFTLIVPFNINDGTTITTTYVGGTFDEEVSWEIIDNSGNTVCSDDGTDGTLPDETPNRPCGTASCSPCPTTGACCLETTPGNFACSVDFETNCDASGGTFLGAGTDCTPAPGNTDRCDCNDNGIVDINDLEFGNPLPPVNGQSLDTPIAIPEAGGGTISSFINIVSPGVVSDVNVTLNATHTFIGDLEYDLTHNGVTVRIAEFCGTEPGMNVTLDDGAGAVTCPGGDIILVGTFSPSNPLSAFNGLPVAGDWILTVNDDAGGDTGTLDSWLIDIVPADPPVGTDCNGNGILDQCEDPDPSTVGACCIDGLCSVDTAANCATAGGIYLGDCTDCETTTCPQGNDICESATVVNCGDNVIGQDTSTANNDYDPTDLGCTGFAATSPDLAYRFDSTADQLVTAAMFNTTFDASIYVVTDCNDVFNTCVAGADDVFVPGDETVQWTAFNGTTYFIIVDGFDGDAGTFDLSITCSVAGGPEACCFADGSCQDLTPVDCANAGGISQGIGTICATTNCPQPPPTNDECDLGIVTIGNGSTPVDIAQATSSVQLACGDFPFGNDQINNDLWYEYVATCTGDLFVDTCGDADDTRLAVYDVDCTAIVGGTLPIECNDDHGNATEADTGNTCVEALAASLSVPVVQGQTYIIRVGSFSATTPSLLAFNLNVDCVGVGGCGTCPGDLSGDGILNGADIQGFVDCLLGGPGNCDCADMDNSGGADLGDLPLFVAAILAGGACP